MKINYRWEKAYLATWIISLVALITFFILAIVIKNYETIFWGLLGACASAFTAFFVAWVVERQANKDEIFKIDKIKQFYRRMPIQKVETFLKLLTGTKVGCDEYLKPYFVDGKLNFDNLTWNLDFLFQLSLIIEKKKLTSYMREIKITDDVSEVISGEEIVSNTKAIIEEVSEIVKNFNGFRDIMQEQNIFNKKEIFDNNEISIAERLSSSFDVEASEIKFFSCMMIDSFIKSLKEVVIYYKIEIEENSLAKVFMPLMDSLKSMPRLMNEMDEKYKGVREKAYDYIEKTFI